MSAGYQHLQLFACVLKVRNPLNLENYWTNTDRINFCFVIINIRAAKIAQLLLTEHAWTRASAV